VRFFAALRMQGCSLNAVKSLTDDHQPRDLFASSSPRVRFFAALRMQGVL
jgi:hypothetical protein